MAQRSSGMNHRKGIIILELYDMFPNEQSTEKWFEQVLWNGERV